MKKVFLFASVAAMTMLASCTGCNKPANNATDSTNVADTTEVPAVVDTTVKDTVVAQDSTVASDTTAASAEAKEAEAKRDINANDIFAKRMERYQKELKLNDKQLAELAEILTVGADRIEKYIAAQERPSLEDIRKFRAEESAKVKKLLNKDQFKKFEEFEAERTKRFEERVAKKAAEAAAKAAANAAK
ncbi:MAG: hypothetical protein MJZ24_01470 [Paludibacteraceae bacterium]|nr:hypothetical protein [Candidatus Physcocola equi]MCQ2233393.1 hypothetical protein [Paludibacteraceae bacterium]